MRLCLIIELRMSFLCCFHLTFVTVTKSNKAMISNENNNLNHVHFNVFPETINLSAFMKCSIYILDPSNSAHLYLLHTNRRSTIEPLQSDTTISVNTKHTGPSTLIKASPLQVCFFLQHLEDSPNLKRHVIKHLKHLDAPIIVHTILPSYKTLDYAW